MLGAQEITHDWHRDIGIALDVTFTVDLPGGAGVSTLGNGVPIKIADGSSPGTLCTR